MRPENNGITASTAPGLDDHVEKIALTRVKQPLRDQEVSSGGNGKELGDSFDHSEQQYKDPMRHGGPHEPGTAVEVQDGSRSHL
jgi:hypothetical protein